MFRLNEENHWDLPYFQLPATITNGLGSSKRKINKVLSGILFTASLVQEFRAGIPSHRTVHKIINFPFLIACHADVLNYFPLFPGNNRTRVGTKSSSILSTVFLISMFLPSLATILLSKFLAILPVSAPNGSSFSSSVVAFPCVRQPLFDSSAGRPFPVPADH